MTAQVAGDRQLGEELLAELAEQDPNFEYIHQLIEQGADLSVQGRDGVTALMMVSVWGDKALIETMVGHGADVNCRDNAGNTPLHLLVACGKYDVIRLLLDAGANVELKNAKGQTPLDCAREWQEPGVAEMMLRKIDAILKARKAQEDFHRSISNGLPVEQPVRPLKPFKIRPPHP